MNGSISPLLLVVLLACIVLFGYTKISNPHFKYSTEKYWQNATVSEVAEVPLEALAEGNKNGPVLMWAASVVSDPQIIAALVDAGASINEREVDFNATALSAAAYQNPHPAIIDELVRLGAKVNIVLGMLEKSPLLLAAESNDVVITKRLLHHGADSTYKDVNNKTALDIAVEFENSAVEKFYRSR